MKYNDIDKLKGIEPIQHRPEMYIGTTEHPTHLWEEVFDNSLDEVMSGYGKNIIIKIDTKENKILVSDDGRGMPVRKKKGIPIPVIVCTEMHTGGKMKKNVNAYKLSSGLHGIGLVAVCALSDKLKIVSRRDNKYYTYDFLTKYKKGKVDWTETVTQCKDESNFVSGTTVEFTPSKKVFNTLLLNKEYIIHRVKVSSGLTNANCVLIWDDNIIFSCNDSMDRDELIHQLIKSRFKDSKSTTEVFKVTLQSKQNEVEKMQVWLYYDLIRTEPQFAGNINLIPTDRGSHIKFFKENMIEVMKSIIKNKTLEDTDYLIGLRCYISCFLIDPRFSAQIKEKLTIRDEYLNMHFKQDFNQIKNKILADSNLINQLTNKFISYRQKLLVNSAEKKNKKKKTITSLKLKDCIKPNGILFIVEGESAGGSLSQCRDPNKHAIYQLRGKGLPNAEEASMTKILTNAVVKDLFNCIGVCEIKNAKVIKTGLPCRYSKIVSLADGDADGAHIHTLVIKFIKTFMPELIKQKKFFIAKTPLFGYIKGKKFIPVWEESEAKKLMIKNIHVSRHKGLGEFSPNELEEVLFNQGLWVEGEL